MIMMTTVSLGLVVVLSIAIVLVANGATMGKPHSHQGVLEPFHGSHLSYKITADQIKILDEGKPVVIKGNVVDGKGRGTALQDVHASPETVLSIVANLTDYYRVVPNVKSVDVYDTKVVQEGVTNYHAKFNVAVGLLKFAYFLSMTKDETTSTFYWTLDYNHSSDFDDNTGQWQVLPHPTKRGWSRIVYATDVKLYSWIPGFVIKFLTNTALGDATPWVRKVVSSKDQGDASDTTSFDQLLQCYTSEDGGSQYDGACADTILRKNVNGNNNNQRGEEL